ncbi:hypothetical protein [Arthrobacter oryzae]|uniref:hypothetical protein n=1 Tax=Arthrobacter oryzae TaxID=409290 RepID=UPI00273B9F00|nr:hypothetical protein [Arthrobacter oryzae]WLQ08146.1 hypothetical protein Q8Z05_08385 [Arthrobacter oryzae]
MTSAQEVLRPWYRGTRANSMASWNNCRTWALTNRHCPPPLLGISVELLERWASGQDAPDAGGRLELADLDALIRHLHSAFTPAQAMVWMCNPNVLLGSRPIDVYRTQGSARVIGAIRAHVQGELG